MGCADVSAEAGRLSHFRSRGGWQGTCIGHYGAVVCSPARRGPAFFWHQDRRPRLTPVCPCADPVREIEPGPLSVKQVHGTDALVVDQPVDGSRRFEGGWDALVTDQPGLMVTVRTADCVPVLLHDPQRRVVARDPCRLAGGVWPASCRRPSMLMQTRFGAELGQLHVSIGPSAGVCCYEVDEPVLNGFAKPICLVGNGLARSSPGQGATRFKGVDQAAGAGLRDWRRAGHQRERVYDLS